jgi:hypothetical protein
MVSDKEFKSYDDLKSRLDKVLGGADAPAKTTVEQMRSGPKKPVVADDAPFEVSADDDEMSYFSKLANED